MGYTPVAIKHVINEAVIMAHFDGRGSITYRDIALAIQTHESGLRSPRQLSPLEKRRLAYHEAGHAVAQFMLLPRWRVSHATIAKRLDSKGEAYVQRKAREEIVTESADEILADIQVSLASRAAEELFLHSRLNGVGGDLHSATTNAIHYVAHWGMGDSFFSASASMAPERIYTDPVLRMEVESVLRRAYNEVKALIEEHGAAVIAVAEALIAREDLTGEEVEQLIRQADGMPLRQASLDQIAVAALSTPMFAQMVPHMAPGVYPRGYAPQMLPQPWQPGANDYPGANGHGGANSGNGANGAAGAYGQPSGSGSGWPAAYPPAGYPPVSYPPAAPTGASFPQTNPPSLNSRPVPPPPAGQSQFNGGSTFDSFTPGI